LGASSSFEIPRKPREKPRFEDFLGPPKFAGLRGKIQISSPVYRGKNHKNLDEPVLQNLEILQKNSSFCNFFGSPKKSQETVEKSKILKPVCCGKTVKKSEFQNLFQKFPNWQTLPSSSCFSSDLPPNNCQLIKIPKYQDIWTCSFANELGWFFQGICKHKGSSTCFFIKKSDVLKECTYTYDRIVYNYPEGQTTQDLAHHGWQLH
jgi:hypothetical protein